MIGITAKGLLESALGLYFAAAIVSLVFQKQPKAGVAACNMLCMVASVCCGAGALMVLLARAPLAGYSGFQFAVPFVAVSLQMDKLSAFFVLCLAVVVFCVSLYAMGYTRRVISQRSNGVYGFLYGLFIISLLWVLTAENTLFFYIAWEMMSVLSFFMVAWHADKAENKKAATTYIIMTHLAAAFLLAAFLMLYQHTGSFSVFADSSGMSAEVKNIVFLFFIVGFGTKAGILPFHIWLPYAYPAAPGSISALMSAIMSKTAVYGVVRFVFFNLEIGQTWWGALLLIMGLLSAVLGSAYAFVQTDIKRLLAYSSIDNIGIVFMGLGISAMSHTAGNHTGAFIGMVASLFHSFNHALFKGSLFLSAASVETAAKTRDMNRLGGLIKTMPRTGVLLLCGGLSVAALIPFNGFVSEWMTYRAIFTAVTIQSEGLNILYLVAIAGLAMTGALAVAAYVKLFGIVFLGKPRSAQAEEASEVSPAMIVANGLLTAMCLMVGVFPVTIIQIISKIAMDLYPSNPMIPVQTSSWYQPVSFTVSVDKIAPLLAIFALISILTVTILLILPLAKNRPVRRCVTWDCGYPKLTPSMQYSATGFSKPIVIVLRMVFRPLRKKTVTGSHPYHPQGIDYDTAAYSFVETNLYKPFTRAVYSAANRMQSIVQTGSVRRYLGYIFFLLLLLMAYNRMVP